MTAAARPFLKWAGGKTQMLDVLVARQPLTPADGRATYFEPFLGGGALFFGLQRPGTAILSDLNPVLIETFEVVRDHVDDLAGKLGALQERYLAFDDEQRAELYYAVRAERPEEPLDIAARMIFLNKTCYNGLYRVNRKGEFNVPHGRYKNPRIQDCETLLAASKALESATLQQADFEQACESAQAGDFVYFDPPFHPLSETSSFTSYTADDFGREDQVRLKELCDRLSERGVHVMISNSPHESIKGLYQGSRHFVDYRLEELPARRMINSRGDRRVGITELVITNYEVTERASEDEVET